MKKYQASPFHRMLTLLLCFAMFISMVPAIAWAAEPEAQEVSGIVISQNITIPVYATTDGKVSQTMEYDCGNGVSGKGEKSYLTIVTGTPSSEFTAYLKALETAGYRQASTNSVAAREGKVNQFATFTSPDGSYKLYTYHLPAYQETRIIIDTQKDTVAGFSYTPTGESVQPMIVQYGLSMSENGYDITSNNEEYRTGKRNCGALIVIRMPDNSLFIHDGGDIQQWSDEACDRFLQFCRELTGKTNGEKMVINTWFLSHAHSDHHLGMPRFFSKHHDKFDLKYIMYNIDIERTYTTRDIHQLMTRIASYYPDVKYYKPHTGESFNIAGIGFDVIYTLEDRYLPNSEGKLITDYPTIVDGKTTTKYDLGGTYRDFCYEEPDDDGDILSDFNDTSTVLRVHMDSETDAILYADMNLAEQILFDIYPDSALETDIMMIPHHGFDSHPELCDLSNAKIFLFTQHRGAIYGADGDLSVKDPAGQYRPTLYNNYIAMQQFIETAGSKTYWAGNETVCLTVGSSASGVPGGMTKAEAPEGFTAYTAEAYSFEYEGWTVDGSDNTTVEGDTVDAFGTVKANSNTIRYNQVTNGKLTEGANYLIVHNASNKILLHDAVANQTSSTLAGTRDDYDAKRADFFYGITGGNTDLTRLYSAHHYRDLALWKLINIHKTNHAMVELDPIFGGTKAYRYSNYTKGLSTDNAYWYTTAADTDAARSLQPNRAEFTMVTPTSENICTEFFSDGTCIIYYYAFGANEYGETVCVITCDSNGNFTRKKYTGTKANNITAVKKDLKSLKLRLYSYKEFSAQYQILTYEGVQEYTTLTTVNQTETVDLITSSITVMDTNRRNMVIPNNGTTPKVGYYYLQFPAEYQANKPGDYIVMIQYRNDDGSDTLVGSVILHVVDQIVITGSRLDMAGTVSKNAGVGAVPLIINPETGTSSPCRIEITVNTANGHVTRMIPLSVGMLTDSQGNAIDTSIEGTFSDLNIVYQGVKLNGTFTLTVTASNDALNYPRYPDEGSVRVTKQGITNLADFSKNGVANIQLSATGKPTSNGVDLIVVMDLSGSMKYGLDTITDAQAYAESRVYAMEQSLRQMVNMLRESGADVRIAMSDFGDLDSHEFEGAIIDKTVPNVPYFDVDFNNAYKRNNDYTVDFYEFSNYLNFPMKNGDKDAVAYTIANSKFNLANPSYTGKVVPTIYTGSKEANAEAFVDVSTLDEAAMNEIVAALDVDITKSNGTNYDVGLEYAYHLGMAIQQKNIDEGEDRDLVVIFMSDGAPMQFNYFSGRTLMSTWPDWFTGNADGIQSLNYSETNKPAGMAELENALLTLLKAGKLTRPDYHRDNPTDGNGYFVFDLTKFANGADPNYPYFYTYMDDLDYDLDWQYLVDIANANGYTNFTYDDYLANPKMPDLIQKLKEGTLVNPYYSIDRFYPQYTGTSTDFYEAMEELDCDANWDQFAKIAFKNRHYNLDGKNPAGDDYGEVGTLLMALLDNIRTLPDDGYYTLSPYAYFYNPDGLNWWAEAIKGKTTQLYPVINKYAYRNSTERPFAYYGDVRNKFSGETTKDLPLDSRDYIGGFRGLDADIYSVSFSVANERQISAKDAEDVMRRIATGPSYFFSASTNQGLTDALKAIASTISSGASRAWYTDTMGPEFDLSTSKTVEVDGKEITVNADPTIRVLEYTLDKNGNRTGDYIVREVVQFQSVPTNGTTELKAWSDQVFDIVNTEDGKIQNEYTEVWHEDGIIRAKYFYYNTNKYVDENNTGAFHLDLTGDGVGDYWLPAETFLWIIGVIGETEMVLDYEVYLTGSIEETREAGLYDTNTKAELQYINYLGNNCKQEVPTPKYPWDQGSVGYSFYLVDNDGNPIINEETGATGSFELSVEMIDIIYKTFNLDGEVHTLNAQELLDKAVAEGLISDIYTLYDPSASYTVTVDPQKNPNGTYKVESSVSRPTTYISGLQYDDVLPEPGVTNTVTDLSTANTTVWFAVRVDVQTYPDAVVIDYGIPVNIHVMGNDSHMPSECAELAAIGAHQTAGYAAELPDGFGDTYTGKFGTATVVDTNASDAIIRYSLNTSNGMQMSEPEQFSYAVEYTGNYRRKGFYCETITVIPAANIYYEDSYLTFTDSTDAADGMGMWQNEYTSITVSCFNAGGWDEVYAYCKEDKGPAGTWPGVLMTDNDNDQIFTASVSADQIGKTVMFNNGDLKYQTADLYITDEGVYNANGSWNSNNSTTVYFKNTDGWDEVCAYWWAGSINNDWPGYTMSYSEATGLYSISVPAGMTNIIFNNNNNGLQTPDLGIVDGGVYQPDGSCTPPTTVEAKTVYFDTENCPWGTVYAYCWNDEGESAPWPGNAMTLDANTGRYSIEVPGNMTNIIFTNNKSGEGQNLGELTIEKDGDVYCDLFWEYATPSLNVFFDNTTSDWDDVYAYYWSYGNTTMTSWPGVKMTHGENNQYHATIPVNAEYIIFSNGTSLKQTPDIRLGASGTVYLPDGTISEESSAPRTYYYVGDNWDEVYAYAFGSYGEKNAEWPGEKMSYDKETGLYSITLNDNKLNTIIFHSGKGQQTSDLPIPASGSIYHGDIWVSYDGDPTIQDEDRPGTATDALKDIDADNVYGYDSAYDKYQTFSLDGVHHVTVNADTGSPTTAPTATFTFTGTGFDVVGLTDSDSGAIIVEVKDANGKVVKNYIVNNYYGLVFDSNTGTWKVVEENDDFCLYQVPVIKVEDLDYGVYTVTIKAAYLGTMDVDGAGNYTIWLDAIRIYNPAKNDGTSNDAYEQDGENNAYTTTVKELLVTPSDFTADTDVSGVIFIEGKGSEVTMAEYANQGPNNETYLKNGNGIAFKLRYKGTSAPSINLHLGAKLALGSSATLNFNGKPLTTLTTASNMFYKLDGLNWTKHGEYMISEAIVLSCTAGTDSILSLTDLKVTGTDAAKIESMPSPSKLNVVLDATVVKAAQKYMAVETEDAPVILVGEGFSLSFEDEILVNFYYSVSDVTNVTEQGMLVFHTNPGSADIAIADQKYSTPVYVEDSGFYACTTTGIAAKEMGDSRYYCAYAKLTDGTVVYSDLRQYSPKQYAMSRLEKSENENLKALCVAMLNYGAAAQNYFGYKTDALMNADLTAEQQALVTAYSADLFTGAVAADPAKIDSFTATETGFSRRGATVSFEGAFALNFYFQLDREDYEVNFYYWTKETYDSVDELTVSNATGTLLLQPAENGVVHAPITGIAAKELDDTIYVAATYTIDGETFCTGVTPYSIITYCMRHANGNMGQLAQATAMYGYYAANYFV